MPPACPGRYPSLQRARPRFYAHPVSDQSIHEHHCAAAEAEIARFTELVTGAGLDTPVPTCPEWTIADLIRHHGTTHRWMDHLMRSGATDRVWTKDLHIEPPTDDTDVRAWLDSGAETLLATLRAARADTPIWTWGADQHVRFWSRRVLFEAVVHRADAEFARGLTPYVDPAIAADGVDEFLANVPHAHWIAERLPSLGDGDRTLHLHATDGDGEWLIGMGSEFRWERGHDKADVAVRGTAGDLLLLVHGRLSPSDERFEVFGDHESLGRWLTAMEF